MIFLGMAFWYMETSASFLLQAKNPTPCINYGSAENHTVVIIDSHDSTEAHDVDNYEDYFWLVY